MAAAFAFLVISCGAIGAGWGYVRLARRMRSFGTTRGRVTAREVARVPGAFREGRWGKGGGYMPKVTYTYAVDGVTYTSDRSSYAIRGLKQSVVEQQLAAMPDDVDVYYDPAAPQEAYLETHSSSIGNVLLAGGTAGLIVSVIVLLTG